MVPLVYDVHEIHLLLNCILMITIWILALYHHNYRYIHYFAHYNRWRKGLTKPMASLLNLWTWHWHHSMLSVRPIMADLSLEIMYIQHSRYIYYYNPHMNSICTLKASEHSDTVYNSNECCPTTRPITSTSGKGNNRNLQQSLHFV